MKNIINVLRNLRRTKLRKSAPNCSNSLTCGGTEMCGLVEEEIQHPEEEREQRKDMENI